MGRLRTGYRVGQMSLTIPPCRNPPIETSWKDRLEKSEGNVINSSLKFTRIPVWILGHLKTLALVTWRREMNGDQREVPKRLGIVPKPQRFGTA